ncbi:MAG: DNA replication/repair protein RecF [Rhodothermales bacterium]
MVLSALSLRGFRAHDHSDLALSPGLNLIHGPNGSGKTNLLEAIHYLALGKSFLASKDSYTLRFGAPFFDLRGTFHSDGRSPIEIRVVFKPDEGKRIFVNGAPLDRLADLVGRVPIVVFAPVDHSLTDGPPEERRRFLDNTLSQARPAYLNGLMKYRRTLKQRNAVLSAGRSLRPELLAPWNEEFVRGGVLISQARAKFVAEFARYLDQAWNLIESIGERPTIEYNGFASVSDWLDTEEVARRFRARLEQSHASEKSMRRTLVGPHRDELTFRLNDIEVRRFASQGQHRTFGMALKLAKYLYLRDVTEKTPLLLLDDVFGDLDQHRQDVFLDLLQNSLNGQSIITTADDTTFRNVVAFDGRVNSAIGILNGNVVADLTSTSGDDL